jgi:N-acetylneuraminic acid mutarotase
VAISPSPSPPPPQRIEASLPVPLEESAAAAAGGKLYVIGGFDAAGNSLRTVWVFDGSVWSAGPRLPLGLDHTSAATLDDQIYVAGGHTFGRDSARFFRLDGATWTELASMHHARGGHALLATGGRLYVIGGNSVAANIAPGEVYDPKTGAWSDLPALPAPRNHVSGFVFGFSACAAGGRSPATTRVDCFDTQSSSWVRFPDLPTATSGAGATALEDGRAVILGGQDAGETRINDQFSELPDPTAWNSLGAMLVPRHGFELAFFEGRAWACGGGSLPGLHPVATCTSVV